MARAADVKDKAKAKASGKVSGKDGKSAKAKPKPNWGQRFTLNQKAKNAIAVLILVISLPSMPYCYEKRTEVARRLAPYGAGNRGYNDVGQRLSMRFRDSDSSSNSGLQRWKLQREQGTWDIFLGLSVLGAFGSTMYLLRPTYGWWQRQYALLAKKMSAWKPWWKKKR